MMHLDTTRGASIHSSVVNTVNTIIGAGVLVLPYAIRADSLFLGVFLIIFAGITSALGLIIQGIASKFLPQGTATFFTVCRLTYPKLSIVFDLAIFSQCFGVCISYLVLTGDLMQLVFSFNDWSEESMKTFYILISTLLIVPLSLLKKIDSLRYTSIVALVAILYICLLIYGNFISAYLHDWKNIPVDKVGEISYFKPEGVKPIFKTLGIIVLAYTCPNQFSIVSELHDPSIKRISKIVYISMTITTIVFISVALTGYLTFGNALTGNILLMYENTFYSQAGRALLVLMVILSFPLMFHPARISINNVYHMLQKDYFTKSVNQELVNDRSPLIESAEFELQESEDVDHDDVPLSNITFYTLSFILLVASYSCALLLHSFEMVLAIVGATGGVLISFVLPGFYGYKLIATDDQKLKRKLILNSPSDATNPIFDSILLKQTSLFLIFWGLSVMMICLYSIIFE